MQKAQKIEPTHSLDEKFKIMFLALLVIATGFGVALQNALVTLTLFYGIFEIIRGRKKQSDGERSWVLYPTLLALVFLVLTTASTLLNPLMSGAVLLKGVFGYLLWVALPWVGYQFIKLSSFKVDDVKKIGTVLVYLMVVWGLVVLSQFYFEWRILGSSWAFEEYSPVRPRGFTSHPLSLAYVAFFFWPLSVAWTFSSLNAKNTSFRNNKLHFIRPLLMFLGLVIILFLTQSRTVQVVALLIFVLQSLLFLKGRQRLLILASLVLLLSGFFMSSHPIAQKFKDTLSSRGVDKFGTYPDDRLIFWHAHYEMILDKPWLGHGFGTDTEYRKPYYEKIGFKDFKKQYEAHNMFIQILTNAGFLGLAIWLLWVMSYFKLIYSFTHPIARRVALHTLWGFLAIVLTQNGFQDAEVRYALTVFCFALILWKMCESTSFKSEEKHV